VTFRDTLTESDRYFVGRLESFGDIVVGFSMSLLALQLDIPKTPQEIFANASRYGVFFLAFAIVSVFWIRFHRVMTCGFVPRRHDLVLLFTFLAFVALTPYALVTYSRLQGVEAYSRESVMLYLAVLLGVLATNWILTVRGMRRAWSYLDDRERAQTWRATVAGAFSVVVIAAALGAIAFFGERAFGAMIVIAVGVPFALRLLPRPLSWALGPQTDASGTLAAADVS